MPVDSSTNCVCRRCKTRSSIMKPYTKVQPVKVSYVFKKNDYFKQQEQKSRESNGSLMVEEAKINGKNPLTFDIHLSAKRNFAYYKELLISKIKKVNQRNEESTKNDERINDSNEDTIKGKTGLLSFNINVSWQFECNDKSKTPITRTNSSREMNDESKSYNSSQKIIKCMSDEEPPEEIGWHDLDYIPISQELEPSTNTDSCHSGFLKASSAESECDKAQEIWFSNIPDECNNYELEESIIDTDLMCFVYEKINQLKKDLDEIQQKVTEHLIIDGIKYYKMNHMKEENVIEEVEDLEEEMEENELYENSIIGSSRKDDHDEDGGSGGALISIIDDVETDDSKVDMSESSDNEKKVSDDSFEQEESETQNNANENYDDEPSNSRPNRGSISQDRKLEGQNNGRNVDNTEKKQYDETANYDNNDESNNSNDNRKDNKGEYISNFVLDKTENHKGKKGSSERKSKYRNYKSLVIDQENKNEFNGKDIIHSNDDNVEKIKSSRKCTAISKYLKGNAKHFKRGNNLNLNCMVSTTANFKCAASSFQTLKENSSEIILSVTDRESVTDVTDIFKPLFSAYRNVCSNLNRYYERQLLTVRNYISKFLHFGILTKFFIPPIVYNQDEGVQTEFNENLVEPVQTIDSSTQDEESDKTVEASTEDEEIDKTEPCCSTNNRRVKKNFDFGGNFKTAVYHFHEQNFVKYEHQLDSKANVLHAILNYYMSIMYGICIVYDNKYFDIRLPCSYKLL